MHAQVDGVSVPRAELIGEPLLQPVGNLQRRHHRDRHAQPVEVTYRTAANAFVLWHDLSQASPVQRPGGPARRLM